jgi:hypothetical protein
VTAGPTCAAAPTATVTATVTVRGNSTLLVAPTPTAAAGGAPLGGGNELVAKSKYQGECPDVIGWGASGYDSPVKLTEVPRATGSLDLSAEAQVGGVGVGGGLAAATNGKVKGKCASKKRSMKVRRQA